MSERPECFAPKSHGYGAGLPFSWQGWSLLLGYLALVVGGAILFAEEHLAAFLATTTMSTILFVWIAFQTTRGGWRWRWGQED